MFKFFGLILFFLSSQIQAADFSLIRDPSSLEFRSQQEIPSFGNIGVGVSYYSLFEKIEGVGTGITISPNLYKIKHLSIEVPVSANTAILSEVYSMNPIASFSANILYQASIKMQVDFLHIHLGASQGYQWVHNSKIGLLDVEFLEGYLTRIYAGISF